MVDTVAIMFSTLACIFMIVRAIRLDRERPWVLPPRASDGVKTEERPAVWTPEWDAAQPPDLTAWRQ